MGALFFQRFSLLRRGLPLRLTVASAFLLIYVPAVSVIVYYNHVQNRARVESEVRHSIELTTSWIVERSVTFFDPAVLFVEVMARRLARVTSPVSESPRLGRTAIEWLDHVPQFYSIIASWGIDNALAVAKVIPGTDYGVPLADVPKESRYAIWLLNRGQSPERRGFFNSSFRQIYSVVVPDGHLNLTARPWHIAAMQNSGTAVSDPYRLVPGDQHAISFSHRMVGADGVVSVNVLLSDLSKFLQTNRVGKLGGAMVFNLQGDVLAVGDGGDNPFLSLPATAGSPSDAKVADLANPALKSMVGRLPDESGRKWAEFSVNGRSYLGLVERLPKPFNGNVYLALTVDLQEFLEPVARETLITAVVSALVALLALPLVFWISVQIARPVLLLAHAARRVLHLDLGAVVATQSIVTEIQELSSSFAAMQKGLAAFTKYVPQVVVKEALTAQADPVPGGEERTISILFTDVQDFTNLSEGMAPRDLFLKATAYYREVGGPILASGGMIGRFMGDGITSYWNVPQMDPDHIVKSAEATLVSRARSEALNRRWESFGRPIMRTRFGLHVGEAIVGNVGLPDRLEYNAMGECLNIASRLEGLNKMYGTQILISEAMANQLPGAFTWRRVDRVMPKGTSIPIGLCELVGVAGGPEEIAASEAQVELADLWNRKVVPAYQEQDWHAALAAAEDVLRRSPTDPLAQVYAKRCRLYLLNPPEAGWDGVARFTEK